MCAFGCGSEATEVLVTVNGWIVDACHDCAVRQCDHLTSTTSPVLVG